MKTLNILIIVILMVFSTSCSKDDAIDETNTNPNTEVLPLTKVSQGSFTGQNGYKSVGTTILGTSKENAYYVRLNDDFDASFATGSVTLYLSSNPTLKLSEANSFIKLNTISKKGMHDFPLTAKPANNLIYVIVWCTPAAIEFGVAELK